MFGRRVSQVEKALHWPRWCTAAATSAASPGCSDRTIRRRLTEWAGHGRQLLRLALAAFDRMVGLDLDDPAVDGAITQAPCGGEVAGRSSVPVRVRAALPPTSPPIPDHVLLCCFGPELSRVRHHR